MANGRCVAAVLAIALVSAGTARASNIDENIRNARKKVFPALVNVQPITETFKGGQKVVTGSSVGSGVIFTKEGHVLTNFHVAGHAKKVICTLGTKERIHGKVVGGDPWTDLAVLQLDLAEWKKIHPELALPVAELGASADLEVGETVMAMGSPLGLARTLTVGVISNTERYLGDDMTLPSGERTGLFNTWLQTDAAISPGNSGGPLVSLEGKVIGINSRAVGLGSNLGFAVPVDLVKQVVKQILDKGSVTRSTVGVRLQELRELEEHFGVDMKRGVLVAAVEPSSPAQKAGLKAGDLILSLDGKDLSARFSEELPVIYELFAQLPVDSKHVLAVLRQGKEQKIEVVTELLTQIRGDESEEQGWGLTVRDLTEAQKRQLDVADGVYVTGTRPGGPAEKAKFQEGDVIRFVDGAPTPDLEAFKKAVEETLKNKETKKVVGVKVVRDKGLYVRAVRLAE